MKVKLGDVVISHCALRDPYRVVLEHGGVLSTFDSRGVRQATTNLQMFLDKGIYTRVGTLDEVARFYQKHHRPPDLEIPGVIRIWVLENGKPIPHPDCQLSHTISPNGSLLAWIWDGPRREVSSG